MEYVANVRLFKAVSANTFAGHSGPAVAAKLFAPCSLWMVFTHPTDAETDPAIGIDHWTSLMGRRRYASMAELDNSSLRRSPRFIMLAMLSNRNREASLGSPSSPDNGSMVEAVL